MKTLIVVLGPTGVGKTELCLSLAEHLAIPIINADSRQIFAELPIGTAAPTAEQQQRVKHYFVGNHHIEDYYSAAQYEADVMNLLQEDIFKNHDVALLTGGSMMYIDAVCKGIDDIPTVRDDIRTWMKQRLEEEGLEALVEELHKMDPEHWAIVDRKNPRRVVHALEICHQTGKTYTSFRTAEKKQRPFRIITSLIKLVTKDNSLKIKYKGKIDNLSPVVPEEADYAEYIDLLKHFEALGGFNYGIISSLVCSSSVHPLS